jgi:urease accessory protein
MPIILSRKLDRHRDDRSSTDRLLLTAEERTRSRHPFTTENGIEVYLQLDRGSVLRHGDRLQSADDNNLDFIVEVIAKPETVLAVATDSPLALLEAAYHLGNRHVSLEISTSHLYLLPDDVLRDLLVHRGLTVTDTIRPFQPQAGAYEHHHH